jgi:uncharacterized protein
MQPVEADAVEVRVLGCLLEKQRTTPDTYPLSLNALRLACNQATNRDPVVEYDEQTVVEALRRLALKGWTRLASGAGSRTRKYRHLLADAFDADDAGLSLLALLMLRGPQTPGELKQRAGRLHPFADLAAVQEALAALVETGYVARHDRRAGQKEDRYEQLLGGGDEPVVGPEVESGSEPDVAPAPGSVEDRLATAERELADLREQVRLLREALGD